MEQTHFSESVSNEVVRSTYLCCSLNLLSRANKLMILSEQHIKLSERLIYLVQTSY